MTLTTSANGPGPSVVVTRGNLPAVEGAPAAPPLPASAEPATPAAPALPSVPAPPMPPTPPAPPAAAAETPAAPLPAVLGTPEPARPAAPAAPTGPGAIAPAPAIGVWKTGAEVVAGSLLQLTPNGDNDAISRTAHCGLVFMAWVSLLGLPPTFASRARRQDPFSIATRSAAADRSADPRR